MEHTCIFIFNDCGWGCLDVRDKLRTFSHKKELCKDNPVVKESNLREKLPIDDKLEGLPYRLCESMKNITIKKT